LLRTDVPPFDRTSGPKLYAHTIDEFSTWAARVPRAEVDVIRQRIAEARNNTRLLEALDSELWAFPVRDVARHRSILSVIGELKMPSAVPMLIKFVWHDGEITRRGERGGHLRPCSFEADGEEMLRARAAEMLSYIGSPEATEATLDIAARHSMPFVRAAAIDSHMYNAGDTSEAADQLRACVAPDDHFRIGLPRLTRDMDPAEFERAVVAFYQRHPEERPRQPSQSKPPGPSRRSWQPEREE